MQYSKFTLTKERLWAATFSAADENMAAYNHLLTLEMEKNTKTTWICTIFAGFWNSHVIRMEKAWEFQNPINIVHNQIFLIFFPSRL